MPQPEQLNINVGYQTLRSAMADARGNEVVFLAHCLLNQNTRYLGGATYPGPVTPVVLPYLNAGVGIVQMPCPEQRVWGGVLKRRFLWLLLHPRLTRRTLWLMPLVERFLHWRYARIARALARQVTDYTSSGCRVRAVVGVAGSPSCGVRTTMDLRRAAATLPQLQRDSLTAECFNSAVVKPATCPGVGLFMHCLVDELSRCGQTVPFQEVSLVQDRTTVTALATTRDHR